MLIRCCVFRFVELEVGKLVAGVVGNIHDEFGLFISLPTAPGETAPLKVTYRKQT